MQKLIVPGIIHNLSGYDVQLFFKESVARKNSKVQFRVIPKTNEGFICITYGRSNFIDSMRFSQGKFDLLLSGLKTEDLFVTKKEIRSLEFYSQKTSYPHECFNSIDDY